MRKVGFAIYMVVTVILLGEFVFWLLPDFNTHPPYDTAAIDREIGWRPKANYLYDGPMRSKDGSVYPVRFTTNAEGFQSYPQQRDEDKLQMFVIGDSFTQAVEVSDEKAYYYHFEEPLRAQVYAYGMAGYGTLQESMILEEYLERVQPDVVLLQFCSNDFIDNDRVLEAQAIYQVGLRRPYWNAEGELEYANPHGRMTTLVQRTNFLKFCWKKIRQIQQRHFPAKAEPISEEKIGLGKDKDPDYGRSVATTKKLLQRVKEQVGPDRQLVVFSSDGFDPQYHDAKALCEELGIPHLFFPLAAMNEMRATAEVYTLDGYHWNELGHKVVGTELVKQLQQLLTQKGVLDLPGAVQE